MSLGQGNESSPKHIDTLRIGLALGGGGVRGLSHVGVLEVLERERIPIHLIVGTSFGSIVGAMYATRPSIPELKKRLARFLGGPLFEKTRLEILRRSLTEGKRVRLLQQLKGYARRGVLFGISFSRGYFISEEEFSRTLQDLLEDIEIGQTQIPFHPVATDLLQGEPVVFTRGSLRKAVQASCSFPGVFQPIQESGRLLVDGGWSGPVPVVQAREEEIDMVIAVDTSEEREFSDEINSGLQLLVRSHDVTKRVLNRLLIHEADIVIRPRVGHIHWTSFAEAGDCIDQGRSAAEEAMPYIRAEWERRCAV